MKPSDIVLIIFFSLNSWIYLHFDQNMPVARGIQAVLALLSISCVIWLRFKLESIPFILIILFTGLLLILSLRYNVSQYFMLLPLIYNFGLQRIIQKYVLIVEVLAESIWMFLSIMFSFCLFGLLSHKLFSSNEQYFATQAQSTLTYMQVATLDQVGRVAILNYQKFGFTKSFGIMVASLATFHILFNLNQAVIMQYVYRKRHNQTVISSRKQLIDEQINIKLRVPRILNVVVTSVVFVFPFQPGTFRWIYMACVAISSICICIQHIFQEDSTGTRNILNTFLLLSIIAIYISGYYGVFYLLCGARIFLIREVLGLWKKIINVLWELSPILSLTLVFFLIFSLLAYSFSNTGGQSLSIQVVFIEALQFMTLDDWTSHLRSSSWYLALLIIVYIILLNHIFLNAIISQSFGQLQEEAEQQRALHKQTRITRFQKAQELVGSQISNQESAMQFWEMAQALGYQTNQRISPLLDIFDQTREVETDEIRVEMNDIVRV